MIDVIQFYFAVILSAKSDNFSLQASSKSYSKIGFYQTPNFSEINQILLWEDKIPFFLRLQ